MIGFYNVRIRVVAKYAFTLKCYLQRMEVMATLALNQYFSAICYSLAFFSSL